MNLLYSELLWIYVLALIPIYRYYQKERDLKHKRKIMLLSFVLFLIVLAFSRPVLSQRLGEVTSLGTEIVIGIDLSASMQAKDILPSRSEKASELLHTLVSSSKQDKFAILGFTSSAIILSTILALLNSFARAATIITFIWFSNCFADLFIIYQYP